MKHLTGMLWFVFVTLAAVGLAALVYVRATETGFVARSLEQIEREEGMAVVVQKPSRVDFTDYQYCDAHIAASKRYFLRSRISEVVRNVLVDAGDVVKEGQLLVEFRKEDIEARIAAREAAFEEARKNYDRYKNLHERGVVSADVLDARLTAKESAAAALREARTDLKFTEVRAPAGEPREAGGSVQVAERMVDPGEYEAAGKGLMTLVDLRHLEIKAHVPETAIKYLRVGESIDFRIEGDEGWEPAEIRRISPSTEDPNRFFDVYLGIENNRRRGVWQMRPGMYAEVRIPRRTVRNALALPGNAVKWEGNRQYVFVVREKTEQQRVNPAGEQSPPANPIDRILVRLGLLEAPQPETPPEPPRMREVTVFRAQRLAIDTGLRNRGYVELKTDDVGEEDRVVCSPRVDLRDGARLKIQDDSCTQAARNEE